MEIRIIITLHFYFSILYIHLETSGFVYGAMSFVDKVSCGAALMVVQQYMPDIPEGSTLKYDYFQWILVYGCGGAAIFGLLMIALLWPMKIGQR